MPQNHPRITALSPPEVFTCGLLVKLSLAAWRAVTFKAKNSNSTLSLASTSFFIGSVKLFTMLLCNQGYKCVCTVNTSVHKDLWQRWIPESSSLQSTNLPVMTVLSRKPEARMAGSPALVWLMICWICPDEIPKYPCIKLKSSYFVPK